MPVVSVPTPYDALRARTDRGQPLLTHYDGAATRVELSVASAQNAVAKAAGLLRDELGLGPGVVSVDLPLHWQLPVWVWAALSAGLSCGRHLPGPVAARLVGPDALADLPDGGSTDGELLACSCDALGMPIRGGVPAGVLDVGVEVRSQPDEFQPWPGAARARLVVGGVATAWQDVAGACRAGRTWVDDETAEADVLRRVALVPLLAGGSAVIGTRLAPEQAARVRGVEGAEA